jgi:hypothetical protein
MLKTKQIMFLPLKNFEEQSVGVAVVENCYFGSQQIE